MVTDALIRLSSKTILIVCYTNHALDQFLEALLDKGITSIIRIGGRSKSQRLEPYNLFTVLRNSAPSVLPKTEARRMWILRGLEDKLEPEVWAHVGLAVRAGTNNRIHT